MKRIVFPIAFILFLTSCVSISDVVPAGPDTYRLSGKDRSMGANGESVTTELFKHASDHCALEGKTFEPVNSTSENYRPFVGLAHAELTFHCISRVTVTQ